MFGSTWVSKEDRWRWVLDAVFKFSMAFNHNIDISQGCMRVFVCAVSGVWCHKYNKRKERDHCEVRGAEWVQGMMNKAEFYWLKSDTLTWWTLSWLHCLVIAGIFRGVCVWGPRCYCTKYSGKLCLFLFYAVWIIENTIGKQCSVFILKQHDRSDIWNVHSSLHMIMLYCKDLKTCVCLGVVTLAFKSKVKSSLPWNW